MARAQNADLRSGAGVSGAGTLLCEMTHAKDKGAHLSPSNDHPVAGARLRKDRYGPVNRAPTEADTHAVARGHLRILSNSILSIPSIPSILSAPSNRVHASALFGVGCRADRGEPVDRAPKTDIQAAVAAAGGVAIFPRRV